jgi:hypothetical protein
MKKIGVFVDGLKGTVFMKSSPQCKMQQCAKFPIHVLLSPASCAQCCGDRRQHFDPGKAVEGVLDADDVRLAVIVRENKLEVPVPLIASPSLIPSTSPSLSESFRSSKRWGEFTMHLDAWLSMPTG